MGKDRIWEITGYGGAQLGCSSRDLDCSWLGKSQQRRQLGKYPEDAFF